MASPSEIEKIVKEEVELEEKHIKKHELLALLFIAALLVVAYSIETGPAPLAEYHLNGNYVNLSGEGMAIYPGSGSFSAKAWIKTSDPGDGIIVSSGECCGAESYWSMGKTSTQGAAVLLIRLNDGTGEVSGSGRKNLADGKWHQVLFVRDIRAKKVLGYVDGELDLEFTDTAGAVDDESRQLMAGNSNPYQSEWFRGYVAEIKTYPESFTSKEAQDMYSVEMGSFQVSQ